MENGQPGIINNFVSRSWLFFFARALQTGLVFLVFWFYSISLSKDLYGSYQQVFILHGVIATLLGLGLPLLIASMPRERLSWWVLQIWKQTRWIYLVLLLGMIVFLGLALPMLPLITRFLLLALSVLTALYILFEIMVVKAGGDRSVFVLNLAYSILFAVIHFGAIYKRPFVLDDLLVALLLIGLARLFLILQRFRRSVKGFETDKPSPGDDPVKLYRHQWTYLSLNQALEIISQNIDNFFLLWLLPAASFAIYFNGAYEIPLTGLLVSVAGTFINVQIRQFHLDDKGILHLFRMVCRLLAILLFPLFFFALLYSRPLFGMLFHGRYDASVAVFLVSCWIIPLRIANYTAILQHQMRSKLVLQGSLLGLTAKLILCPLLYKIWDIRGVAAAIVLGTAIQIVFYLFHSAVSLKIRAWQLMPVRSLFLFFAFSGVVTWTGRFLLSRGRVTDAGLLLTGICILLALTGIPLYYYCKKIFRTN